MYYSWPLNKMGLTAPTSYTQIFFSKNDQVRDPQLAESANAEPRIPRACVGLEHP